jgi:photosystem II stability/assembly factor-like uncharacterized protein
MEGTQVKQRNKRCSREEKSDGKYGALAYVAASAYARRAAAFIISLALLAILCACDQNYKLNSGYPSTAGALDAPNVPDALAPLDTVDASDASDAPDASDTSGTSDTSDTLGISDTLDAINALGASDALDTPDAPDALAPLDTLDASDAPEALDTPDVLAASTAELEYPTLNGEPFASYFCGFTSGDEGWYVGSTDVASGMQRSYVFLTCDGGTTWVETGNANDIWPRVLTCAAFASDKTGFLCFRYDLENTGPVYRTEDGGKTWERHEIPAIAELLGGNGIGEVRKLQATGDGNLEMTYFASREGNVNTGLLYTSASSDSGKTWGALELARNAASALDVPA